jgi:hypothetical protein
MRRFGSPTEKAVESVCQVRFTNLVTNRLIVEIDRKFASVSSLTGISMLNSSSTSSTSLTASNEVNPAPERVSSEETGRVIERSLIIRWTTATTLSPAEMLRSFITPALISVFIRRPNDSLAHESGLRPPAALCILTADAEIEVNMTGLSLATR